MYHAISKYYPGYSTEETDKQFDICLKNNRGNISAGTFFHYLKEVDIHPQNIMPEEKKGSSYEIDLFSFLEESPTLPSMIYDSLPVPIKRITKFFSEPRAKDVFLLSLLTITSSICRRLFGFYDRRKLGANLITLISAPPASDKGIAATALSCIQDISAVLKSDFNERIETFKKAEGEGEKRDFPVERRLVFPGNITKPGLLQLMNENPDGGLIFETETDTMGYALKMDYSDYSDVMRKAFHHEIVNSYRKTKSEFIEVLDPHLSILMTGTPKQILGIIHNAEDGLFSRILYYSYATKSEFRNPFPTGSSELEESIPSVSEHLFHIWSEWQSRTALVQFKLTDTQEERMKEIFINWHSDAEKIYGHVGITIIRRYGIIFFRLCMVLTILHLPNANEIILCRDKEFETALELIKTIREHAFRTMQIMPKDGEPLKPDEQSNQKLFEMLPPSFRAGDAKKLAEKVGVTGRTVLRWLKKWVESGKLQKDSNRTYIKD